MSKVLRTINNLLFPSIINFVLSFKTFKVGIKKYYTYLFIVSNNVINNYLN